MKEFYEYQRDQRKWNILDIIGYWKELLIIKISSSSLLHLNIDISFYQHGICGYSDIDSH